jgi:hypothetical protein
MTALTDTDRDAFRSAIVLADMLPEYREAARADALDVAIDRTDVVETQETYHDFCRVHGAPHETVTFGEQQLHIWNRVQMARGRARGKLYLMEFRAANASFFTGESA